MKEFYTAAGLVKKNDLLTGLAAVCDKVLQLKDGQLTLSLFLEPPSGVASTMLQNVRSLCGPYSSTTRGVARF